MTWLDLKKKYGYYAKMFGEETLSNRIRHICLEIQSNVLPNLARLKKEIDADINSLKSPPDEKTVAKIRNRIELFIGTIKRFMFDLRLLSFYTSAILYRNFMQLKALHQRLAEARKQGKAAELKDRRKQREVKRRMNALEEEMKETRQVRKSMIAQLRKARRKASIAIRHGFTTVKIMKFFADSDIISKRILTDSKQIREDEIKRRGFWSRLNLEDKGKVRLAIGLIEHKNRKVEKIMQKIEFLIEDVRDLEGEMQGMKKSFRSKLKGAAAKDQIDAIEFKEKELDDVIQRDLTQFYFNILTELKEISSTDFPKARAA